MKAPKEITTAPKATTKATVKAVATSFCAEMGQTCPAAAQIVFKCSRYRPYYLTVKDTTITLSGRGIIANGTSAGGATYYATEAAMKMLEAKYICVYRETLD